MKKDLYKRLKRKNKYNYLLNYKKEEIFKEYFSC